jgi:hypothetical protein
MGATQAVSAASAARFSLMVIGLRIGFANLGLRVDEAGSRIERQLSYRACMPADQPCAAGYFPEASIRASIDACVRANATVFSSHQTAGAA